MEKLITFFIIKKKKYPQKHWHGYFFAILFNQAIYWIIQLLYDYLLYNEKWISWVITRLDQG